MKKNQGKQISQEPLLEMQVEMIEAPVRMHAGDMVKGDQIWDAF